jgi:hypothetical protein
MNGVNGDSVNRWLSANALKVVGYVLGVGIAWGLLTAAVRDKVDTADLQALRVEVIANQRDAERERAEIRKDAERERLEIRRLLCRIAAVSSDTGCDAVRGTVRP